jgi:toluene monooxygenase system protein E
MTSARDIRAARSVPPARRTYWCLEGTRRKPTDYEVTSTALLYYPSRGFEVETPTLEHYAEQPRTTSSREAFADPAKLTYSAYVAERRDQESFLDRLLERPTDPVPRELAPLVGLVSALRFPLHGFQMVASYIGALAPNGRITICCTFQAADELRRIQRLCQWLSRSGRGAAELDALGRELWQQAEPLQPLRRLVEELLVTYDWEAALVALNGVIKPVLDHLWFEHVQGLAERHDDEVLEKILSSLGDDGLWHEAWFLAFCRAAHEGDAGRAEHLQARVGALRPRVAQAIQALLPLFGGPFEDEGERAYVWRELDAVLGAHLEKAGLAGGGST